MELIFDDESGTWGEAPETYGCIEFATKEAYEEAVNILKNHKKLEAKHWDECRQIAHYDNELREAKRLLKLALQDMNGNNICDEENACNACKYGSCVICSAIEWKYPDEALKLIGGSENG